MKKYFSGLITGFLLCLGVTTFAAVPAIKTAIFSNVNIEINGVKQDVEVVSVVQEGKNDARNYVSVYDLGTAMGGEVNWNGDRQTVEIKTNVNSATASEYPDIEEWILLTDLLKYGLGVGAGGDDGMIYIYKTPENKELLLKVKADDTSSKVKVKIVDNRGYISKTDLIREGYIVE